MRYIIFYKATCLKCLPMTDFCALILNIVTLLNSYTNRPFTENNWALQSATFVLSPGVIVTVNPKKPIKNCFLICYSLVDLMDANHVGRQSWMFCGPVPSDEELSSENPEGSNLLLLGEKIGLVSSILFVWHCARDRVYDECLNLSYLF